ncbi:hypothetical protein ccbrp13_69120 [Ktedonobacteria bacterium brp13]|nr:hypothetical protein ccbrp13_69120 [Ktedonobacteria bacterium brp13]
MQDITPIFFDDDNDANDDNYDDVDQLFNKLETFQPPVDMVARIMNAVSQMPSPLEMQRQQQRSFLAMGGLIAHKDDLDPS